eukprot:1625216-Pleurochrysis_carterae.AAC.11
MTKTMKMKMPCMTFPSESGHHSIHVRNNNPESLELLRRLLYSQTSIRRSRRSLLAATSREPRLQFCTHSPFRWSPSILQRGKLALAPPRTLRPNSELRYAHQPFSRRVLAAATTAGESGLSKGGNGGCAPPIRMTSSRSSSTGSAPARSTTSSNASPKLLANAEA